MSITQVYTMTDEAEPKFRRDKEGKIKLIVETFLRLIETKGYANVSTNLVAKEAGISIGTLYNYFENKAEILRKGFETNVENFIDFSVMMKILVDRDYKSIKYFVSKFLKSHQDHYQLNNAYDQAIAANAEIFQSFQENTKEYIKKFTKIAKENSPTLKKVPENSILKAIMISTNLLDSMVHQHLFRNPIFDTDEELIEYLVKFFQFTLDLYISN